MSPLGALVVGALVAMVTWCGETEGFIPVRSLRGGHEARAGPDDEIDRLAMREYANQLRQEQRRREAEAVRAKQQQYRKEAETLNAGKEMDGQLFGPAYHRKLGHRFHRPQYPPQLQIQPQQPMNDNLRPNELDPHIDLLPKQNQPEVGDNEVKETTVVKESTKPVSGSEGKVINVENVEPVVEQEEEKIPQEGLHPTPAYHQARENNGLNPIQNAANMADVYFLGLKRDVIEVKRDDPSSPDSAAAPPKAEAQVQSQQQANEENAQRKYSNASLSNIMFIAVVAGCSVAGLVGLVVAGVCWYRLQKNVKAASEAEYPAYGITGPTKERIQSPGDRKLAQSAQMYHYQHQKQQMIALEKANSEMKQDGSDEDSDEENEEGDYTVYECPGLAPTGEMEVKNPLFSEDTPVTPTMPANK